MHYQKLLPKAYLPVQTTNEFIKLSTQKKYHVNGVHRVKKAALKVFFLSFIKYGAQCFFTHLMYVNISSILLSS